MSTVANRRTTRALVALLVIGVGLLAGTQVADAEAEPGRFTVVARADALALEYVNTGAPVVADGQILYLTPSSSQSVVDGLGRSEAFASAPYPGELAAGLSGNANGLLVGNGLPGALPMYPFIVRSSSPGTPTARQEQIPFQIRAESAERHSSSRARLGLSPGAGITPLTALTSSRASLQPATGNLTSTADARIGAFDVTELLELGRSTARAELVRAPGKPAVKTSSFTLASLVVAGVEIGLNDRGFVLPGQTVPTPELSAVFAPLRAAGITVEYLPSRDTPSSIESAGLRVSHQVDLPDGSIQRTTLVLGRVAARIESGTLPQVLAPNQGINLLAPRPSFPAGQQTASLPPVSISGPPPASSGALPETWDGDEGSREGVVSAPRLHARSADVSGLYLALILAAVLGLLASRLPSHIPARLWPRSRS